MPLASLLAAHFSSIGHFCSALSGGQQSRVRRIVKLVGELARRGHRADTVATFARTTRLSDADWDREPRRKRRFRRIGRLTAFGVRPTAMPDRREWVIDFPHNVVVVVVLRCCCCQAMCRTSVINPDHSET